MDCIFCEISKGKIPATIIYQDDTLLAFNDIRPKAPTHVLIIPRKHIATLNHVEAEDVHLLGKIMHTAQMLAKQIGIADAGYRVVMNCNADGGQEVNHIHLHLLGGRAMTWPPG